jgi:hypothetical protein
MYCAREKIQDCAMVSRSFEAYLGSVGVHERTAHFTVQPACDVLTLLVSIDLQGIDLAVGIDM